MEGQIESVSLLIVKGVVLPVVGLLITIASAYLPKWIASHVRNASTAGILERLSMLALTVVQEVQQTVISTLDKPNSDQLKAARDAALESLKSHLGTKGLKELMQVFGLSDQAAAERLLLSFIESAVHRLKSGTPVLTTVEPVQPSNQ